MSISLQSKLQTLHAYLAVLVLSFVLYTVYSTVRVPDILYQNLVDLKLQKTN